MPDSQVDVPIGLDIAPAQQSFKELIANAAAAGKKMGDSLGVGVTSNEKRLHRNFDRLFESIASGGNIVESVFQGIGNSVRLSLPLGVALIGVKTLYEAFSTGIEVADKFGKAFKNAVSFSTQDLGSKSVEEINQNIEKLKQDEADTNLTALSSLQQGATVLVQALEKGQSLSTTILQDAQQHLDVQKELNKEIDIAASKKFKDEADLQELHNAGLNEEATRLKNREALEKTLVDARGSATQAPKPETIAQIQRLIAADDAALVKKRQDTANEKTTRDFNQNLKDEQEAQALFAQAHEEGLTNIQKEVEISNRLAQEKFEKPLMTDQGSIDKAIAKDTNDLDKLNKEDTKNAIEAGHKLFQDLYDGFKEKADIQTKQAEVQSKIDQAETNRALGIGSGIEVSSLRKVGLGGRVGVATKDPQVEAIKEGNNTLKLLQQKLDAVQSKLDHLGAV